MGYFSFLDPELRLEIIAETIDLTSSFFDRRIQELTSDYQMWEKENTHMRSEQNEWYESLIDSYQDRIYVLNEIKKVFLNGLAISVNTIFERNIQSMVRAMSEKFENISYKERHTYRKKEVKNFLKQIDHPNYCLIEDALWSRLWLYSKFRNCIVHHEGYFDKKDKEVKYFMRDYPDLLKVENEQLSIFAVTERYLDFVVNDIKSFFHLALYNNDGNVIF